MVCQTDNKAYSFLRCYTEKLHKGSWRYIITLLSITNALKGYKNSSLNNGIESEFETRSVGKHYIKYFCLNTESLLCVCLCVFDNVLYPQTHCPNSQILSQDITLLLIIMPHMSHITITWLKLLRRNFSKEIYSAWDKAIPYTSSEHLGESEHVPCKGDGERHHV